MAQAKPEVKVLPDLTQIMAMVTALQVQNAELQAQIAAGAKTGKPKPNAHGYLPPVESTYTIDKGKRKGEVEKVLRFEHYANPQWSFSLSRNKAAAVDEHSAVVSKWSKANPPVQR